MSIARQMFARIAGAMQAHHQRRADDLIAHAEAHDDDDLDRAKAHVEKARKWQARTGTLLREPPRGAPPPAAGL